MKDVIGRGEVEIHDNTARTGEKLDAVLLADEEKSSSKAYGEIIIVNHLGRELALQNLTEVSDDQIDMESRAFLTGIDLEQLVRSTLA
jgi:hypothetical protein